MADSPTETTDDALSSEAPVVSSASTPETVVNAEPTPAEKPASAFDAVVKALEPAPKPGVDAAAPTAENRSSKDDPDPKTAPPAEPADISEDEMKRLSTKTQERVRWLAAQRTEAIGKLETAAHETEALRPKAESYDQLYGYLTRNGISDQEANNSLEVTRLIKTGDYTNALQILTPIYQEVQRRAGEVLDPDLTEDVRLGHVPHERALELQRLRANDVATRERGQRQEEQGRQQHAQEQNQRFVSEVAKAADDWAKGKAGHDPDWDKKQIEVAELVELDLRTNGFPKSKEEAIQRSEQALRKVEDRWKKFRGGLQEVRPIGGAGRASIRANDPPKSALEAIDRALGG